MSRRGAWAHLLAAVVLPLILVAVGQSPHHSRTGVLVAGLVVGVLMAIMVAHWWSARLVATPEEAVSYHFFNWPSRRVRFDEIVAYRPSSLGLWGIWRRGAGERTPPVRVSIVEVEPIELHRVMVLRAPKALRAKRLVNQRLPPAEDFPGLWMFDGHAYFSGVLGALILAVLFMLIFREHGLGPPLALILLESYRFPDLLGRLTVDVEGITARWPWEKRSIRWSEATAIFCEHAGTSKRSDRRFVITSRETSIVIPRRYAHDREVMKKVIYSLPSGTPCVGFDERIKRGWGKRRRRGAPSPMAPEPVFGF